MHVEPRGRSRPRFAPVAVLAALLVVCLGATAAIAAVGGSRSGATKHVALAGTWSGKYSGAYSGKFTLQWTQRASILKGSIMLSNPKGKYSISGTVTKGTIKFGVVGVGAKYTGTQSGKSMSGRYTSPGGNGSWSAQKTS